jgi:hypothetical protein
MNIHEIDWRIDPLYDVIVGIEAGLKTVEQRLEDEEGFDGITANEHAESLLGLGFVAAQTYAVGSFGDLNRIRKSSGKPPLTKSDCYAADPITVKGGATRIEFINATANYFKHHGEWPQWPTNETTRILAGVGITKDTEFPCVIATQLLSGNTWELIVLHQIVKEWRANVLSTLKYR